MKENICEYGLLEALAWKISWDTFNMVGCFDSVKVANMKSQNSEGFICWWHAEKNILSISCFIPWAWELWMVKELFIAVPKDTMKWFSRHFNKIVSFYSQAASQWSINTVTFLQWAAVHLWYEALK